MSEDQREMLVQLAEQQGQSLAAFCRDRIMARENMAEEFAALQSTLLAALGEAQRAPVAAPIQAPSSEPRATAPGGQMAVVVEVLLLMRSMAQPTKVQAVHGELKRLGLEPYKN
ncbi:hypothetical protein [Xanthomonas phaseoli]|uniref:hypothetical protein n=1 Tax=Xanthomonas phaseoli TaxID=1985254 RepID=UPI001EE67B0B|nr:hypothetical protein [Xanthomonas phaseoli]